MRSIPSIHAVWNGLKHDSQIWERLLWTSGGLLELKKCRFYIMSWKFQANGQGSLLTKAELNNPPLALTAGDTDTVQEVQQLDLNDSFKTLSIHKTVSGNQQKQIEVLMTTLGVSCPYA
jgi:hypothetical protein